MTCLTRRAVHIEVVHGLSTESRLNAMFRFIAQRDKLDLMVSNNGKILLEQTITSTNK